MKQLDSIRTYFRVVLCVALHLALKNMLDIPHINREGASLERENTESLYNGGDAMWKK